MQRFSTLPWGYWQLTSTRITIYHHFMEAIKHDLQEYLTPGYVWQENSDRTVTLVASSPSHAKTLISELVSLFKIKETNIIDTPDHMYKIPAHIKPVLKSLSIAFEGCIGVILTHELAGIPHVSNDWRFLNSKIGGLGINPYTLLFYHDHPKIIHPVNNKNFHIRDRIERTAAFAVKKIVERVSECQPGYEGFGMLSYVQDKTGKTPKEVASLIYKKSVHIQNRARFSLLQQ